MAISRGQERSDRWPGVTTMVVHPIVFDGLMSRGSIASKW